MRKFTLKFPNKVNALERFLESIRTTLKIINVSSNVLDLELEIRDFKDRPVLRSSIECNADILITGDKDLLEANVSFPKIINPSDFYCNY